MCSVRHNTHDLLSQNHGNTYIDIRVGNSLYNDSWPTNAVDQKIKTLINISPTNQNSIIRSVHSREWCYFSSVLDHVSRVVSRQSSAENQARRNDKPSVNVAA